MNQMEILDKFDVNKNLHMLVGANIIARLSSGRMPAGELLKQLPIPICECSRMSDITSPRSCRLNEM